MFDYLQPRNGPVVDGMEAQETVYAADQPQYIPLRTLVSDTEECRVFSRWTLTEAQRKAVADGADIFLELMTFGNPLTPIRMAVSDGNLDLDWVKARLLGQLRCPRCGMGFDTDGDGNCPACAKLTDEEAAIFKKDIDQRVKFAVEEATDGEAQPERK